MFQKKMTITNSFGLHARPAVDFVRCASGFVSKIQVCRPGEDPVNAKSIIMLLSRGFAQDTEVEITAEGPDEQQAVEALAELLASGCGEEG